MKIINPKFYGPTKMADKIVNNYYTDRQIPDFKDDFSSNDFSDLVYKVAYLLEAKDCKTEKFYNLNIYDELFEKVGKDQISFDLFLSFCEEDAAIAEQLDKELTKLGIKVWFSRKKLKIGDSILKIIGQAIRICPYAIVLLSENTFKDHKHFPILELKNIINREMYDEMTVFPIYHGVNHDFIRQQDILISDIFARNTNQPIDEIAREISSTIIARK